MSRYSRPPNTSLYVRNVPDGSRPEELKALFGKYGAITDVYVPLDYYTRRSRGFAYIQFEDARDAEDAMYNMDRYRFYGRELEVEFARGDRKTPSQMRVKDRPYNSRHDDHDRKRRHRSDSRSPKRKRSHSGSERKRSPSRSVSRSRSYDRRRHESRKSKSLSGSRSPSTDKKRGRKEHTRSPN